MTDYISRQAAIEALQEVSRHYTEKGREWHPHVNFMVEAIEYLPSAVVRCKDCKHWETDWAPSTAAPGFRYCGMIDGCTQAHDYCSKGEKKDGDPDA